MLLSFPLNSRVWQLPASSRSYFTIPTQVLDLRSQSKASESTLRVCFHLLLITCLDHQGILGLHVIFIYIDFPGKLSQLASNVLHMIYNDSIFLLLHTFRHHPTQRVQFCKTSPGSLAYRRGTNMSNTTQTENREGHLGLGAGEGDRTLTR